MNEPVAAAAASADGTLAPSDAAAAATAMDFASDDTPATDTSASAVKLPPASGTVVSCAITAFPPPAVPVHVLDAEGHVFPARLRSEQDDFREAVRSLDLGTKDDRTDEGGEEDEAAPANKSKHPLEACLQALGMAQAELNQLINLVDMAKAGGFIRLVRGAKMVAARSDSQAGAQQGATGSPALLMHARKQQLSQANSKLKHCAAAMNTTAASRRTYEAGIAALRRNWRIVAPGHTGAQVARPLVAGEVLAVDCCATSKPATLSAAQKHAQQLQSLHGRAPAQNSKWLVPLESGDGGVVRLAPGHLSTAALRTLVVELRGRRRGGGGSSSGGGGGGSGGSGRRHCGVNGSGGRRLVAHTQQQQQQRCCLAHAAAAATRDVSAAAAAAGLHELERYLHAVQHSALCEAVFETVRAEALAAAGEWLDLGGGSEDDDDGNSGDAQEGLRQRSGSRKRAYRGGGGGGSGVGGAALPVAHVLDDEVEVQVDDELTLAIVLQPASADGAVAAGGAEAKDEAGADGDDQRRQHLLSVLSRLALLELNTLVHDSDKRGRGGALAQVKGGSQQPQQQQQQRAAHGGSAQMTAIQQVVRLVQHHIFRQQVCGVLRDVSTDVATLGIHTSARWTHFELQDAFSRAAVALGANFNFTVALRDAAATVTSLPGARGFGTSYQRCLPALRAPAQLAAALRGEVRRQLLQALARQCSERAAAAAAAAEGGGERYSVQASVHGGVVRVFELSSCTSDGGGGGGGGGGDGDGGGSGQDALGAAAARFAMEAGPLRLPLVTLTCECADFADAAPPSSPAEAAAAAAAAVEGTAPGEPFIITCTAHGGNAVSQLAAIGVPVTAAADGVAVMWQQGVGLGVLSKLEAVINALLPLSDQAMDMA